MDKYTQKHAVVFAIGNPLLRFACFLVGTIHTCTYVNTYVMWVNANAFFTFLNTFYFYVCVHFYKQRKKVDIKIFGIHEIIYYKSQAICHFSLHCCDL